MLEYLEYLKNKELTESHLNLDRMERHLKNGWQLESDIPRHMGLGSSASFIAAIYDRYKTMPDSEVSMDQLQQIFATMEDFMHGKSRSEENTSERQSRGHLVCRLMLEKNNND